MSRSPQPSPAAQVLAQELADQPTQPIRPRQLKEYHDELNRLTQIVDGRDMDGNPAPWIGGNRAEAAGRRRKIQETLERQAPKRVTGERANRVYGLVKDVIEQDIKPGLLPQSVMMRAPGSQGPVPAGAVGQYMRTENSPTFKQTVMTVKRAILALDPENPDPDLCSMERFRPSGAAPNGAATFMADAVLPGNFAFGPAAKANWPFPDPPTTAVAQVQQREARPPKGKRILSPAQRAALERAHAARRTKVAAAPQGVTSPAAEDVTHGGTG